jgi:hypothetical protein
MESLIIAAAGMISLLALSWWATIKERRRRPLEIVCLVYLASTVNIVDFHIIVIYSYSYPFEYLSEFKYKYPFEYLSEFIYNSWPQVVDFSRLDMDHISSILITCILVPLDMLHISGVLGDHVHNQIELVKYEVGYYLFPSFVIIFSVNALVTVLPGTLLWNARAA